MLFQNNRFGKSMPPIQNLINACRACITAGPTYIITNLKPNNKYEKDNLSNYYNVQFLNLMQRYGGLWVFPKKCAKSSRSCCDGVGEMRQREAKGQNPVVNK